MLRAPVSALSAVVALALLAPGIGAEEPKARAVNLDELKYAVTAADKRGENVELIRDALTAFEKALAANVKSGDVPPELTALRDAVETATRKGENVAAIAKELAAVEKALTGREFERPKPREPRPKNVVTQQFDWPGIHVYHTAFSTDGRYLLGVGDSNRLRVWEVSSGNQLHEFPVNYGTFTPDGKQLLGGIETKVALYDLGTGKEVRKWELSNRPVSFVLSRNGTRLLTGDDDNVIRIWDVATGKEIGRFEGHTKPPSATFSADEKQVLSAAGDGTVRVWDVATGKEVRKFEGFEDVDALPRTDLIVRASFIKGGRIVGYVWGKEKFLLVWDAATGKQVKRLELGADYHKDSTATADGSWLLTCQEDRTVRLRDLETGKELLRLAIPEVIVARSPSFSPDGRYAAAGGYRGRVYLWELPDLSLNAVPADPEPAVRPGRGLGGGRVGGGFGGGGWNGRGAGGNGAGFGGTSITVANGTITVKARKGDVSFTVSGPINGTDGPKITIQDGEKKTETDDIKQVPEEHRPTVERMLRIVQRG